MAKVILTEFQANCYKLYKQGSTQEAIAIKLLNNKFRQGDVSSALQRVGEKIGMLKVKQYSKNKTQYVEMEVDDD